MRKLIVVLIICMTLVSNVFAEEKKSPDVKAQGAILMDFDTGRVLWEKNSDKPMPMASTTKIMTAIMAIESGKLDEVVVASKRAACAPQVKMGLSTGEKHVLSDLLYPLMLQSSNDSAIAIAEHIGGTVEEFCRLMTVKATELGAKDTVFETPNGLDSGDHHSTAYDMALITRYALNNEKFKEIINTRGITIPVDGGDYKSYSIVNKNRLLNEYDGALGVKTGFTGKAGQCFVGAAKRGEQTLITVVLASGWGTAGKEQKWRDTKSMLNYGFETFNSTKIIDAGTFVKNIPVLLSREGSVGLSIKDEVSMPLSKSEAENIKTKYLLPQEIEAPVDKGTKIGKALFYVGEELLGESDIIADNSIARHDFKTMLGKIINNWLNVGGECIL